MKYICNVDLVNRRVSVRTDKSVEVAKKIAQLALLDHGYSARVELSTSLLFETDGDGHRWINLWW